MLPDRGGSKGGSVGREGSPNSKTVRKRVVLAFDKSKRPAAEGI